jgi:hypothetical protein
MVNPVEGGDTVTLPINVHSLDMATVLWKEIKVEDKITQDTKKT